MILFNGVDSKAIALEGAGFFSLTFDFLGSVIYEQLNAPYC
jgi:hypothetical protein